MTVSQMLDSKLELDNKQKLCDDLELNKVLEREVSQLSGGELQRFAIAMSCIQRADVYVPCPVFPSHFITLLQIHVRRALKLLRCQTATKSC
jgi:translation initiation factor RLI1